MGVAAVRGDRAGRGDVRPRCGGLEVEHPDARRCDPRVGWQATRGHQDRDRGAGGDRERVHDLPADQAPALRRGRDGDRRHGQRPSGRPDADGRAPWHGRRDRRGAHARRPEAQRPVRWSRPRCADRAAACDRGAARRARRRGRARVAPRGVDGRLVQRRGVPRAGRGAARHAVHRNRRPGRARVVGAGPDGDGHGRAAGRQGRQRGRALRARQAEPPHPSRAGSRGGAGDSRAPSRGAAAVRDPTPGRGHRDRQGLRCEDQRAGLRGRELRARERLGRPDGIGRNRWLDPARERPAGGRSERRDRAARHHRRLRQHPRAERARAARRVRARGRGGGGLLRALRGELRRSSSRGAQA